MAVIAVPPGARAAQAQGDVPAIAFEDRSDRLHLPDRDGVRRPFTGEAFALVIGDMGGRPLPDLYLNHHHRWIPAAATFPDAHVILDPGHANGPTGWQTLTAWDQHGAVLIDIDGDGDRDIVEASGGNLAEATWEHRDRTSNRVFRNTPDGFIDENIAAELGLSHELGRTYAVTALHLGGRLGLIFGVLPRPDTRYPTALYVQQDDGSFAPEPERFRVGHRTGMVASIATYRLAIPGFFDDDDTIDLILSQNAWPPHTVLFRGTPDGYFITTGEDLMPSWPTDGVAVPGVAAAPDRVWLTQRNRRLAPWYDTVLVCCTDTAATGWQPFDGPAPGAASYGVTRGDFDNDMDVDVMSLVQDDSGGWGLIFWENDGAGRFRAHRLPHGGAAAPIGITSGDLDLDGTLDLVIGDAGGTERSSYTLLMGRAPAGNWLQIDLRDPWSLDGLGARIRVTAGGQVQTLGQTGGGHWAAQDHVRLHVGLGRQDQVALEVSWPDGTTTRHATAANRLVTLTHPGVSAD
ncbi:ASPIC/UnbV domain-containing protein [Roseicyclus elongatus]|uniref:ASPIC/UnbV domain-containing protein n=1 Tax=Roseicyclus elongatus TaxID=159346 RepID=UPI0012EBAE18|nr:ASPIC/UnbV domain-containing protein [Roseibacterium elongatum]